MRYLPAVLVAGVALFGCDDDDDDDDFGDDGVVSPRTMATAFTGVPGFQQIQGDAMVTWTPGDQLFNAVASISGDAQGLVRPWHVHFGTCATGGAIVGSDAQYPRLVIGADGTATAAVDVRYELSPNVPYHINFHKSDAELDTIIACGDLLLGGVGGSGGGGGGGPY
jgi:hypothetical protein